MSSSGGNAGLAAAYSAKELCIPITVVVPEPTPEFVVKKLVEEGATVEVVGKVGKGRQYTQCRVNISPILQVFLYGFYFHHSMLC